MAAPTATADRVATGDAAVPPARVASLWLHHLLALFFPGVVLIFLWTGPHPWYWAAAFLVPFAIAHQVDTGPWAVVRQPSQTLPAWPFDLLVYLLAALQFWVVWELVQLFRVQHFFSVDMAMVFLVVGAASGFSIVTAHELIHRKKPWEQALGRLLLCTVLYEHFYTEHLRGHHVRVGTPEDPATARFGESYEAFFRRTVPGQLRSAWRLEKQRLGDPDMRLLDPRMLHNRVLHGLVVEWSLAFAILAWAGFPAFFAFVLQAWTAVRLLEAVNYFEHWGLLRSQRRVRPVDSWDTHAGFTYYGLIGLTRHADHHAWPSRPFQQLRVWEDAPILPFGYVGTVDQVLANNGEFQRAATEELARRGLGPFAGREVEAEQALSELEHAQAAEAAPRRGAGPGSLVRSLPAGVVRALAAVAALLAVTAGVQWETGGQGMGFAARLALHAWIAAAMVGSLWLGRRVDRRTGNEGLAFAAGTALAVVVGLATDWLVF